jgi:trehalose 6-phosphate phosphatase
VIEYDNPKQLARQVAEAARPLLLGLDVDGVLAPIVSHAKDASLLTGIAESVTALAGHDRIRVAVISGRSVGDLERFSFDSALTVVGSHGMEIRGQTMEPLDRSEAERLAELTILAEQAAQRAGDGAWVENKPASVTVHIRDAEPVAGAEALNWLRPLANAVAGAETKTGSAVLELFTRAGHKGRAVNYLRGEFGASTAVFVGDDVTDEDAFSAMNASDITIKVGEEPTLARHRLPDPESVRDWLHELNLRLAEPAAD